MDELYVVSLFGTRISFPDPPPSDPVIVGIPSDRQLLWYEGDQHSVTCEITGGLPLANITWNCPQGLGFIVSHTGDDTKNQTILTSTANRNMNNDVCTCSARHIAWIPEGIKNKPLQPFIVYCK